MQTKDFPQHVADVVSILDGMEQSGFDIAHNYKITLHGGISLFATNVSHVPTDSGDRLVTIMGPTTAKTYERSTVLASEIQMVTMVDVQGIAPGAAEDAHQDVALRTVDAIMDGPENVDILKEIHVFAARSIAARTDKFLEKVRAHLEQMKRGDPHCEFIPLLQSLLDGDHDPEDVRAVAMMFAVDISHRVSKDQYEPFITEHDWRDKTLAFMRRSIEEHDETQEV